MVAVCNFRPWARIMCQDLAVALTKPLREKIGSEQSQNIGDYRARLGRIAQVPLNGYPDELLRLYDDAPVADASTLAAARKTVEGFADDMIGLRETFELADPERWFEVIDADRNPKRQNSS